MPKGGTLQIIDNRTVELTDAEIKAMQHYDDLLEINPHNREVVKMVCEAVPEVKDDNTFWYYMGRRAAGLPPLD